MRNLKELLRPTLAAVMSGALFGPLSLSQAALAESDLLSLEVLESAPQGLSHRPFVAAIDRDPRALPDGAVAAGGEIAAAYFIEPTNRYAHGILGDAIEAAGLVVETTGGNRHEILLEERYVFEDLTPRLADLDGDGSLEIITIRAEARTGAAIAIYGLREGELRLLDTTPEIGTANRWLNPAGVADYDGEGSVELAYIQTPHIGGRLYFWRLVSDSLELVARLDGLSNHAIGARDLGLSHSFEGSGLAEPTSAAVLLVPENGRRSLALVAWREGRPIMIDRLRLPSGIAGDFRPFVEDPWSLAIPLYDGSWAKVSLTAKD